MADEGNNNQQQDPQNGQNQQQGGRQDPKPEPKPKDGDEKLYTEAELNAKIDEIVTSGRASPLVSSRLIFS